MKASSLRASSIGLRRYCSLSNFRQMLVLISYRQVQKQENLTFATSEFYEIFREHFVVHSLVSAVGITVQCTTCTSDKSFKTGLFKYYLTQNFPFDVLMGIKKGVLRQKF